MSKLIPSLFVIASLVRCGASDEPGNEPSSAESLAPVVCTRFEPSVSVDGESMRVSLDTDLPNFTKVMVSARRSYNARDEDGVEEYAVEYFSESIEVGALKQPILVDVGNAKFEQILGDHLDLLRRAQLQHDIVEGSMSEEIEVGFTVPVNQPNAAFAKWNANLEGTMVTPSGNFRLIQWERGYPIPLQR